MNQWYLDFSNQISFPVEGREISVQTITERRPGILGSYCMHKNKLYKMICFSSL